MSYNLKALREEHRDTTAEMRSIFDQAKSTGRTLTKEESRKFEELNERARELSGTIRAAETLVGELAEKHTDNRANVSTILADTAFAVATGKRDLIQSRDIDTSSGSAVIQDPVTQDEIIHTLTAQNELARLGVRIQTVENHSLWPTVTAGPATQWFAEGDTLTPDTSMTVGSKQANHKTCVALVKVSKLLLHDATERTRRLVNTEIINQLNEEIIRVVLSGASGSNEPVGLDNVAGLQTVDAGQAVLADYSNHISAAGKLLAVNVPLANIGYVQGITSWEQEAAFADTTGQPLMMPNPISTIPSFATSAVLENYGAGTDETRIYVGDWSQMIIGMGGSYRLELVERYSDTMHTAFLVYMRMDSTVLRPNNFVRIENIATA